MKSTDTVLITGASGFAGRQIALDLHRRGCKVRAASRTTVVDFPPGLEQVALPDLSGPFDGGKILEGMDYVVHLAGLAHSSKDQPDADYQVVNRDATVQLAIAAAAAGVSRFVFVSSVRAQTGPSALNVLTEEDEARPSDAYGRSKLAAESLLTETLAGSHTSLTVLRPVLMYGPGVKGNMLTLSWLARTPWPLPLGGLIGRRSLLSLENFSSAIVHVLQSEIPCRGVYLVADDQPVSVAEIIATLRAGLGRTPRVFTLNKRIATRVLSGLGRQKLVDRLFGDLIVSTAKLRATGWTPPQDTRSALAAALRAL